MNKKIFAIFLFVIVAVSSATTVLADNWGMVGLSAQVGTTGNAPVLFIPENGATFNTLNGWWNAAGNGTSTISRSLVAGPTGNGMQIDYSLENSNGNYGITGLTFDYLDLTSYDYVSFYVSGKVSDAMMVIGNDSATNGNNYKVRIIDYVPGHVGDLAAFTQVKIPLSAFFQYKNQGKIVDIQSFLKRVSSVQFRVDANGAAGSFVVDELLFYKDTNAPVADVASVTQTGSRPVYNIQSVVTLPGVGYRVDMTINEAGVVTFNSHPAIWLELSATRNINASSEQLIQNPASANWTLRSIITVPSTAPRGTGFNVWLAPSRIIDGMGQETLFNGSTADAIIASVDITETIKPVLTVVSNFDFVSRKLLAGETLRITINITEDTAMDMASTPLVRFVDYSGHVTSNLIGLFVANGPRGAIWTGSIDIANSMALGLAHIYISNVKDTFGNEASQDEHFNIVSGLNDLVVSVLKIDQANAYDGDYLGDHIHNISALASGNANIATYNVRILDHNGSDILGGLGAYVVAGATTSMTVSFNSVAAVNLPADTYKIIVSAGDTTGKYSDVSINVTVSGSLIQNLMSAPNPFNPKSNGVLSNTAHITFSLSKAAEVELRIYSISGELLCKAGNSTVSGPLKAVRAGQPGFNEFTWDGKNDFGETVANGVYLGYLVVKDGSKKTIEKVKIAVLK